MKPSDVDKVARWIDRLGIAYVVVGGSAIERTVPVGTKDVDVLIAIGDWGPLDAALENRRDAAPLQPISGSIRGTIVTIGTRNIDLEFISGEPFSGERAPDEFIEYVRKSRSSDDRGIRYADASVVWYMRLSTNEWEEYVPSIRRDARAGVTLSTLDQAVEVATHFGVRKKIAARVDFVRETLHLFDRPSGSKPGGHRP